MCIIVMKNKEVKKPSIEVLEECFYNNNDGAGIAVMKENHIDIKKGFMTFDSFLKANESITDNDTVAYHFRIATSGGVSKGLCHPFPITRSETWLKSTMVKCSSAFIHNGVIGSGSPTLSDTALYVKNTLSRIDGYLSEKALRERIETDTFGSRTVYMNAHTKTVLMTGNWITDNDGLLFSNTSYKPKTYKYSFPYLNEGDCFENLCPECGGYSTLISEFHGLRECDVCHAIIDNDGYIMF